MSGQQVGADQWPEEARETALNLHLIGMPVRAIAEELEKRHDFKISHVSVHKRIQKLIEASSGRPTLVNPLTRANNQFVALLQKDGYLLSLCKSATLLTPWSEPPPSFDPFDVDDEGCRGRCWLYGWHKETGRFIGWIKESTNTTTVLKCCSGHNHERRARQVGRVDQCLDGSSPRYVFEEFAHYKSASSNARRHEIPILLRSTNTPRGKLYFVVAGDQITSRRTAGRSNLQMGSRDFTLELLDRSLSHVDDLARVQTTRGFRLREDEKLNREKPAPKGYEIRTCRTSINPFAVASEVLGRDVDSRSGEYFSDNEWRRVRDEIERRKA